MVMYETYCFHTIEVTKKKKYFFYGLLPLQTCHQSNMYRIRLVSFSQLPAILSLIFDIIFKILGITFARKIKLHIMLTTLKRFFSFYLINIKEFGFRSGIIHILCKSKGACVKCF